MTRLHPKLIDLSLSRVHRLLDRLDHPERRLPPVVHVAGTNGKGSMIAFLRAFLEAAGYRVHVHTSPHLVRFNERIRLAGALIGEEALSEILAECERVNDGEPITFFEITTVAAMLAFARTPADVVLLETGLGGRLDATNVIETPALTAITPISLDHQRFLGDSIEAIAAEKAGIIKANVRCLSSAQEPTVRRVLGERAAGVGAPIVFAGDGWVARREGDALCYASGARKALLPLPALEGAHQIENAGLALACLDHLSGFAVPEEALARGLRTVEWPARLQRLDRGPLPAMVPEDWEVWVDGGHNAAAARTLAAFAERWRDKPLYLVVGMLNSRAPETFLAPLAEKAALLRTVTIPGEPNALGAEEVARAGRALGVAAAPARDVAAAVRSLVQTSPRPARVLIAGSLYLAGSVLRGLQGDAGPNDPA